MILIDIYVAALNRTYDFRVDENIQVGVLLQEVVNTLSGEKEEDLREKAEGYNICSYVSKQLLPKEKTLRACGVQNGHKLLLV